MVLLPVGAVEVRRLLAIAEAIACIRTDFHGAAYHADSPTAMCAAARRGQQRERKLQRELIHSPTATPACNTLGEEHMQRLDEAGNSNFFIHKAVATKEMWDGV
jgi:hypothetical protein